MTSKPYVANDLEQDPMVEEPMFNDEPLAVQIENLQMFDSIS